ncbi:DUF6482 family protein [Alteromonas sp. a30]|uniref:DUF6482 family protein n=1 Tax=Alteromonas sp. a30 TaxID=2730917 RepID=UPI002280357D|nr:DUF6482 family protein [Alteromonas sp. a30]MCY7294954.1 hypothetical protein [Alteromonas sp. a30]
MKIFIDAILGGMYLVSTEEQGTVSPLQDSKNKPLYFQCLEQIKQYFEDELFELEEVWLRKDSLIDHFLGCKPDDDIRLNWAEH